MPDASAIENGLNDIISDLQNLKSDAALITAGTRGHKSANKRLRRNLQDIRAKMKTLRATSLEVESAE